MSNKIQFFEIQFCDLQIMLDKEYPNYFLYLIKH